MAWLAGVVDVLVLGEVDGEASDAETDADDTGADGEAVGVCTDGGAVIAGGGVVAQADSSTSAVKPPRARNEMAMPQR